LASRTDGLPGVGFPCLEVELVKIRNGRSGIWQFGWKNGTFRIIPERSKREEQPPVPRKERHYA
jgi:protein ImuA